MQGKCRICTKFNAKEHLDIAQHTSLLGTVMYRFRTVQQKREYEDFAQHAMKYIDLAEHATEYIDFAQNAWNIQILHSMQGNISILHNMQ